MPIFLLWLATDSCMVQFVLSFMDESCMGIEVSSCELMQRFYYICRLNVLLLRPGVCRLNVLLLRPGVALTDLFILYGTQKHCIIGARKCV